jgi:chloramphenicol-sensitive protein RarD
MKQTYKGITYGLVSYIWWGGCIFYFKAVVNVLPAEVLSHRIFWSSVILILVLLIQGNLSKIVGILRNYRTLLLISTSAALIAINWFTYIWAILLIPW